MSNLTKSQQDLADLLVNTKIEAKIIKRLKRDDGSYYLETSQRPTSPIDFAKDPGEFALKMHETKIDAPLSPIYVNLRNLPQDVLEKIAQVLAEVKLDETQDFCTGIPKAAVVIAKEFSKASGIPMIDVYEKIGPDTDRKIVTLPEVCSKNHEKLLVIDDVVAHGKSKQEALEAAKQAGFDVSMMVLIDREQGGVAELEEKNCKIYAAMKITDILNYYMEKNMITKDQYQQSMDYLALIS